MTKRICICATQVPFVRGGAELHVESLQRELLARGFQVEMVRVPFKWYPRSEISKSVLAWRLLDLTESYGEKIDMVIATKFPSYAVKHPHKVVWLIHQHRQAYDLYDTPYGDMSDNPGDRRARQLIREIDNRTLGEARRIFTNAQNTANRLAHYNGIQGEALYHPPKLAGRLHNQSYGDYVLSPSRLDPTKRINLLLEAMAHVKSQARCIISGSGSETERLHALAEQLGVSERVEFAGFVSEERLVELYANCFSVYYAPFNEDYGYVTLEAFNARKPVITASDSGGVLEFVEEGRSGYICQQGEPKKIAARIDQLYAQRELCQRMGNVGHEKVRPISWDNVIAKLTAGII